ncbi:hypothetical protein DMB92_03060 [Campylobacter sp. MIT 99-7217]|uniref:hypothetical protein n=1 Tax=Campylobacter sp. MIT 99-7217 TaxID=535091 RepID=UPI0011587269|nr:hypothetical protein [Campylobacter sp. MIT 99-7217]TQR32957.1 hypothetical protein DMB92_03060 [Campylobacter sp. MIT 99-7217]
MKLRFLFFLSFSLAFGDDFITLKEYAKMLYENPRGISCKECHGDNGKEQILGYYTQKDKQVPFVVPDIRKLSFKEFEASLKEVKDSKSIMPTYSLTTNEIIALYNYIKEINKE